MEAKTKQKFKHVQVKLNEETVDICIKKKMICLPAILAKPLLPPLPHLKPIVMNTITVV